MSREDADYLTGKLLVAMPTMPDNRFSRSVIYIVAHTEEGAMGLVVNKPMGSISFSELLDQLDIEAESLGLDDACKVLYGGPVESGRGFVLHTEDYLQEGTTPVDGDVYMTATIDILKAIAAGNGPRERLLALGYAGWAAGQLDEEIQRNDWLHVDCDLDLLFAVDLSAKWERALAKIGIRPEMLSGQAGRA